MLWQSPTGLAAGCASGTKVASETKRGSQLQSQGGREMSEEGWGNKAPLSPHPPAAALPWHSLMLGFRQSR